MFEKVNPCHPDKVADRIAGAIVDAAYAQKENPKVAVEVLIGHGECFIIVESDVKLGEEVVKKIVKRVSGLDKVTLIENAQDIHLNENQNGAIRCGDNGIFKGMPVTEEQRTLTGIAHAIYDEYKTDGKYILNYDDLIICQSNDEENMLADEFQGAIVNPLGFWTGGLDVDSGATNRKLGSDMGDSVTGGGLHGKDLSKADVSVNIYAWIKAQLTNFPVELCCAIGDEFVDGVPYSDIVDIARCFIKAVGGFEKFAEWGLIR